LDNGENQLIANLPGKDRAHLLNKCALIQLPLGQVLSESDVAMQALYFPVSGFISVLARVPNNPDLEIGMVGREGLFGLPFALGLTSSRIHASVQVPGDAWRITAQAFREELQGNIGLQLSLNRYLQVVIEQLQVSCVCLRFHTIGERLATWLLTSLDRSNASELPVTQELIATMLGVRRVGISTAANLFRQKGLIEYNRGRLTVLNRTGLEQVACNCYAQSLRIYKEVL
jgi:CRP-like cAMP-binding protein